MTLRVLNSHWRRGPSSKSEVRQSPRPCCRPTCGHTRSTKPRLDQEWGWLTCRLVNLGLVAVPLFLRTNDVVVGDEVFRGHLAAQAVLLETLGDDSTRLATVDLLLCAQLLEVLDPVVLSCLLGQVGEVSRSFFDHCPSVISYLTIN